MHTTAPISTPTNPWQLRPAARAFDWGAGRLSSIAMRLVAVVLVTGVLAFGALGSLTLLRFNVALEEQAGALGQLSERQLAVRLDGEAQLARARLERLGMDIATQLRQIAHRGDIAQAIEGKNEVAIRELLHGVAEAAGYDRLLAFTNSGEILASDAYLSLLRIHTRMPTSTFQDNLVAVLAPDNSRSNPRGYEHIKELPGPVARALDLPIGQTVAYVAIEPVFEEFGDLIGALVAIRTLGRSETTLENFTTLANAGVVILRDGDIISSAGPQATGFSKAVDGASGLRLSNDGAHVARCIVYVADLKVCTFTDVAVATASRDQMFRIGAKQTRSMMDQFLLLAALTLTALVIAIVLVVRHTTRGLSSLASAAKEVAHGNLQVEIAATGVGEVRSLSLAFIHMLTNLRKSMGCIEQLAYFDTVTTLPNREKIRADAPGLIESEESGVVFFIDLDGFKSINDTFGHRAGDALLKQVASRIAEYFDQLAESLSIKKKIIARLSGDEFIVILADKRAIAQAGHFAHGAISSLNRPFNLGGPQVTIGASIGITEFPKDGADYDTILVNADLAMYAAKQNGRNSFALYTAELADQARTRLRLERDLKSAILNKELSVYYQPIIDCRSGRICRVEALVRWDHPQFEFIDPAVFMPIAEEIGVISEIDQFVIGQSIQEIGALMRGGADLQLSVNVTATEIGNPDFLEAIATLVHQADFPSSRLEIEVTESVALQNPEVVSRRVAKLRRMGVRLAVDDFGAGYSNLASLARLPIDTLKLDRALLAGVATDPEKQSIVRVALGLAKELGLDSIVEGVETAEEFNFVVREGATMVQGFFCSPAIPLLDLVTLIGSHKLSYYITSKSERSVSAA